MLRVPSGTYTLTAGKVSIVHRAGQVFAGGTAFPAKRSWSVHINAGQSRTVGIGYAGIVNPGVRRLPPTVLTFLGDPRNPSAVVLETSPAPPPIGTIFTSGPTEQLPDGLVAKVVSVDYQGASVVASLAPVPVAEATPEINFTGNLSLVPAVGSTQQVGSDIPLPASPDAAASSCSAPKLVKFGAHLDSVELRRAFLGAFPPQMAVTVAVRTTEFLGVTAAAVGLNCDFALGQLGPYHAGIPIGPIVVPVFATIPLTAGIHVNGTLKLGTINVASTTVAAVAAGFNENSASLSQQGSNVWFSDVLSLQGTAKLSASLGLQLGIGLAGANVHVEADFGPEFKWSSDKGCDLVLNLGSLSAGATAFGKHLDTPPFTPFKDHLWSGCVPTSGGDPGGGGTTTTTGDGTPDPGVGTSPGGSPSRPASSISYTGATTGSYHHPVTLSAHLVDSSTSSGLAGRVVDFTLGSQSCSALTDLSGDASCSITLDQTPGDLTVGASFGGDSTNSASSVNSPFTLQRSATMTTYAGPAASDYYDAFTASATLSDPVDGTPIVGKIVTLVLGDTDRCQGVTDAAGRVACSITPTQAAGAYGIVASFAGDSLYLGSGDSKAFTISREETVTTLTAAPPTSSTFGKPVTFTAASAADPPGGAPAPSGSTDFAVDGTPVGSSVLAAGSATTATASLSAGLHNIVASYGGDHNFLPSSGALPYTVTCAVNISGTHQGALTVTTTTCLAPGAHVAGPVLVKPGGALDVESSTIKGAIITSDGAGVIRICGSAIDGSVEVSRSAALVLIGDPGDASCAANRITGALSVKGNAGGVELIDNAVDGAILTEGDSGPGPYPGDATTVSGNHRPVPSAGLAPDK